MINLILLDPTIVIRTTPIAPVIWYEQNGIIFQDLKYDRFDEAIEFLKENYIPYDTLCRSVEMANRIDLTEDFCEAIRYLLKNDCSLIAVEKVTNKIVGIVVMTIMRQEHRSWLFWNFLVNRSAVTKKIFGFQCNIMLDYLGRNKTAIVDVSLHVAIVTIARSMKGKLFKEDIILQAAKVARSVGAKSISYIATSNNDIERARRVGFKEAELRTYNTYMDENRNYVLSNVPAGENCSIIFINCVGAKANTSIASILYTYNGFVFYLNTKCCGFHALVTQTIILCNTWYAL